jgi:hypothetical protein
MLKHYITTTKIKKRSTWNEGIHFSLIKEKEKSLD